jgi:hypothetical protein
LFTAIQFIGKDKDFIECELLNGDTFRNIFPEQTIVPFILRPFPRCIGVCEVCFSAPLLNLCEVRELRAVVYSNRLENLAETIAVLIA